MIVTAFSIPLRFSVSADIVKISFRSVDEIAVNTFAEKYFDGGGHLNAAGGRSDSGLNETVKKFTKLVDDGKMI